MKKIFYFLKSYKFEILTTLIDIIIVWITLRYSQNIKIILAICISIIILTFFIILYLRMLDKDFYFISLSKRKDKDDWIGRGRFEYSRSEKCYLITDSDSGYIYSKCLIWSDYSLSFEFKIIKDCLGTLLRAINLSNYVMLQIKKDGINPHIRINGAWRIYRHEEAGLSFKKELCLDKWYKCSFLCDKELINIQIFDNRNEIFNRKWDIPQGNYVFKFKKDEHIHDFISIPFSINLEYGSVGFRNWGYEKALIRNVLVEKI